MTLILVLLILAFSLVMASDRLATSPSQTSVRQDPGIERIMAFDDSIWCGAAPTSEGLEHLRSMGVKTVISVDGAVPDHEQAAALGIRYIHLPLSYGRIPEEMVRSLAAAVHDLKREPVYLHCHHGRHRCAAAAAVACVALNRLTPEEARDRMKICGTSSGYDGLWSSVSSTKVIERDELEAIDLNFPRAVEPQGMIALMVDAQDAMDRLKADLVSDTAASDAAVIAEAMRAMQRNAAVEQYGVDFARQLDTTWQLANALERALATPGSDQSNGHQTLLGRLLTSCTACHRAHRR